jgi:hypothetical protein
MQLRHTFVLAAGTAAALAVGGAAFAAGSDDSRPKIPRVTSPSTTPTVRSSATPTVHPTDDHRGHGTDDPAGDDRGGARSATSPAAIRSTATPRTIAPTRHGADHHGRGSGSGDRAGDDHGRGSGSDDRTGDDYGRHSGRG